MSLPACKGGEVLINLKRFVVVHLASCAWQKVRNMKSKTAGKFNAKRLQEKHLRSDKKKNRRRDFD